MNIHQSRFDLRTSAARSPGRTINARIKEKATEIELTSPKSLITGTGDRTSTMNPQMVVPADIIKDEPVVAYISLIEAQVPMPDSLFASNFLHT